MVVVGDQLYRNALIAGGLGFITFGWDAGVLGGILLTPEFQSAMKFPGDTWTISMTTSIFLLASWLGCIIVSCFGLFAGRRTWIIMGEIIQIVGTIISASSYGWGQLLAGRLVIGIGNGFCTSMIPVFVAEMAVHVHKRGQGVNLMIGCASIGTALAYWVDFGMVFASGQAVWRFPVAFQIFWSLLTLAFIWPLPDTPRYYFAKGLPEEGDVVLERMFNQTTSEGPAETAKKDILASLELEKADTARLRIKDFFWDTSDLQAARRIRTGVILVGGAYLIGTNMIFYYMTTIFQVYIGLEPLTASGLAGAATTVLAITNIIGVIFMEKLGRRKWLIGGAIGQSIFLAAFTGLISTPGEATGAAAAAMLFCWIAVFGPTWGPVTYVYASEIMPLRYRHIGFALSISSQWVMAFVTVFAGPIAIADENVGWKTWIWFLVFNVLAGPFVYFCCPETRGRSLEEIDLIFMSESMHNTDAAKQLEHDIGSQNGSSVEEIQETHSVEKSAV
ncbi:sugar transporter-like protein [Patellaria atrata CBS 101060]|uniref:Sugar transporter-like protein n=1 Tax=Patellaria atrata CBS 101060 TaxID=1346257 RepID=A0A9P4SGG2_9PEZI|nr:sugar transporter-like protein [Patellaria atrata CBS 101060]